MLQISPFILMAAMYVTAGAVFAALKGLGIFGPANLNWLRVHVVTVGTVLQLAFALLPALAARKLGTAGRPPREGWLQWGLVNLGFVLIIAGVVGVDGWTAAAGGLLLFVAVVRLLGTVGAMWRAAGRPWRESLRFYLTAPLCLLLGIALAVSLLLGWWAPGGRAGTFEAHVHANVWGFFGLMVAGTLLDLFPAVTGTPLARPKWVGLVYYLQGLGAAALIAGPWAGLLPLQMAGIGAYFAGTLLLIANMILTLKAARRVAPEALQLLLAYFWMLAPGLVAPLVMTGRLQVEMAGVEAAALQGLVNGWILGVVFGALPRVLRTRAWLPDSSLVEPGGAGQDGSWLTVGALNLGVALVWGTALVMDPLLDRALMAGGYGLIVLAWLPLLRRVWGYITEGGFA